MIDKIIQFIVIIIAGFCMASCLLGEHVAIGLFGIWLTILLYSGEENNE